MMKLHGSLSVRDPLGRFIDLFGGGSLALLAFSGSLKGTVAFSWVPVDLTILAVVFVVATVGMRLLIGQMHRLSVWLLASPLVLWSFFLFPLLRSSSSVGDSQKAVTLFTITFVCSVGPLAILSRRKGQVAFFGALLVIALITSVDAMFGNQTYADDYSTRIKIDGATTITTARMLACGTLLCFVGIFSPWPRIWQWVSTGGFALLLMVSLGTGSRGPIVSVGVAISVVLLVSRFFRGKRPQGVLVASVMVLFGVFAAVRTGGDGVGRVLSFLAGEDESGGSGRDVLYGYAVDEFLSRPLGIGWGEYNYFGHTYPHNLILEVGVEGGFIVLGVLLVFLCGSLWCGYRISDSTAGLTIFALLVFSFCNAMLSSDINGNRLLWVMIFGSLAAYGSKLVGRTYEHGDLKNA